MIQQQFEYKDNNVAFVFSHCTVMKEALERPDFGSLGLNFSHLVYRLNRHYPNLFVSSNSRDYNIFAIESINNEYDLTKLVDDNNLTELKEKLASCETVICFGGKAQFVLNWLIKQEGLKIKLIKAQNLVPGKLAKRHKYSHRKLLTDYRTVDTFKEIIKQLN